MENKRVPELRFAGFSGDWEERKLDSMVDRLKSYSLSRDVETSEYTGYKYIHYGDIHTKVADIIDESSNLPNIKAGKYELLEKGDLVLADASEDYQGIATPAVITIDTPYKLVSGLHTIALRPKQVDSLFLYYLINSPTFRKYGYKTGTGMKVFGISVTNLLKFEGMLPLLEEQTKIGNFFKQLDDMIALQQRELDALKETKKAFLQKMFPKGGESAPEVRFPGFAGDWEQRKLKDIVDLLKDGTHGTHKDGKDAFLLSAKNIKSGQIIIDELADRKISSDDYNLIFKNYNLMDQDLLITIVGTIGQTALYTETTSKLAFQRSVAIIRGNKDINQNFLKSTIDSNYVQKQLKQSASMSAQAGIYLGDLEKLIINIPKLSEQTKIGNFFKQLDDMIALQQRELDALTETKKAFLQKMFV